MIRLFLRICVVLAVAGNGATAWAHFLWIVADPSPGERGVHVYFSETAESDDPELLSRLHGLKVQQELSKGGRQVLEPRREKDSLVALPVGNDKADSYSLDYTYGVHSRNGQTYLLVYHARTYPASAENRWNAPTSDRQMPLEIIPSFQKGSLHVRVLWNGHPVSGAEITVDPAGKDRRSVVCDAVGTQDSRQQYVTERVAGAARRRRIAGVGVMHVVVGVLPPLGRDDALSHSQVVEWICGSRIQSHWPCSTLWPISMFSRILETESIAVPASHAGGNSENSSAARPPSSSLAGRR